MARKASFPAALYEHDFVSLARTEGHARTRLRWLGLAHLKEGKSYEEVVRALKVHAKSVMSWVKRLARAGVEGVREQSGRGAKPKLAATYAEALQEALSQAQASRVGGRLKGRDIPAVVGTAIRRAAGLKHRLRHPQAPSPGMDHGSFQAS